LEKVSKEIRAQPTKTCILISCKENIDDYESENEKPELDDVPDNAKEDAAKIVEPSFDSSIGVRRSGRIRNAPGPWWANTAFIATYPEPQSFQQAITCD
jgi:hypothetical protein